MDNDSEEILRIINQKQENKNIDYKECFNWINAQNDQKFDIVKDILAMSNTKDGGKIIFGLKDKTFEHIGLSKDDFSSFDQTKINDFLQKYTDPKYSCQVIKKQINDKYVIVIDMPEFADDPIICKRDAHSSVNQEQILKKGQIYIRTENATSQMLPSAQEMRELLGRAIAKKGDNLLRMIEGLIKGKEVVPTQNALDKYNAEIDIAREKTEQFNKNINVRGRWELIMYPAVYDSNRITDQKDIKQSIVQNEVNLRGWNFPHTDSHGGASYFNGGWQSATVWDKHLEAYQAFNSGLFIWKRTFWEDTDGQLSKKGRNILSYVSAIWTITEIMLFAKRYYERNALDETIIINILLCGTNNRALSDQDRATMFWEDEYIALEDPIERKTERKYIDIQTDFEGIARDFVKKIFMLFGWEDISEAVIQDWQRKLIERKF
jgi:hypothetical protein